MIGLPCTLVFLATADRMVTVGCVCDIPHHVMDLPSIDIGISCASEYFVRHSNISTIIISSIVIP